VQPQGLTPPAATVHSRITELRAQAEPRAQKRPRTEDPGQQASVELNLRKYIERDTHLLSTVGWNEFVRERRGRGDLGDLVIEHPAARLLRHVGTRGVPIVLTTPPWDSKRIYAAATRGPHKSAYEYQDFLRNEMVDMILRRQWIVLPYHAIKDLPGLRLSPIGVVPQRDR